MTRQLKTRLICLSIVAIVLTACSGGQRADAPAPDMPPPPGKIKDKDGVKPPPTPRLRSATIIAGNHNYVYRGIDNPFTIYFETIPIENTKVSAPGLKHIKDVQYTITPGDEDEIVITVSGKLPDGSSVMDKKTYRVLDIPNPDATIGGYKGKTSLTKEQLVKLPLTAQLNSLMFDFDIPLEVTSFIMYAPGQTPIQINGNVLNTEAKKAVQLASKGDLIAFVAVKVATGIQGQELTAHPVLVELK